MLNPVLKPAPCIVLALLIAGPLVAQENSETVGLEIESQLSRQSLEKIADGSASVGKSKLTTPASSWPIAFIAALALGLAGFAAGVLITRRKTATGESEAPVALWVDAEKLQADLEELEGELKQQQHSNEELSSDREQLVSSHAEQIRQLRSEKVALEGELHALRLRGNGADDNAQELIDQLRVEIEQLRGADVDTPDRRDLPAGDSDQQSMRAQVEQQQEHIKQLEELLRGVHDENEHLEQHTIGKEARLAELEDLLLSRNDELAKVNQELDEARAKAELLDEKESRVATLDSELTALRDEMNQLLGKTGQFQILIPQLEKKLSHRQEQIGALESNLQETNNEVIERDRDAKQWEVQVGNLREALEAAELRIASLETDLSSALEENELLHRDTDIETLHQEAQALRQQLREATEQQQAAAAELEELQAHRAHADEWNSTVTSLQAEIRRKSTLIDSQADHLASREKQLGLLRAEMRDLRQQLVARSEESRSLSNLLEQSEDAVVSLSDQMSDEEQAASQLRLARQSPAGDDEPALDPIEADIEALKFTARSRRDLGDSLETILQDERVALEQASRRISLRDEEVMALKNDLSANRVAMVAMQSHLNDLSADNPAGSGPPAMDPSRVERELQQSMRVLESLRADLHRWRSRVKPLHEALVSRNERIRALEAEVTALRNAQGLEPTARVDALGEDGSEQLQRAQGELPEQERSRTLDEMKHHWDRIVALETDLAETGAKLARVLELDDARCRQIESLELARSAQEARLAELRAELSTHGIDPDTAPPDIGGKVVDMGTRRPS